MANRQTVRRWRLVAAWLAVAALLIDGLLPTAVAAATASAGPALPFALCGATAGRAVPDRTPPDLPARHCALCCPALVHGWIPTGQLGPGAPTAAGKIELSALTPAALCRARPDYRAAQPRAPPEFA